MDNPSDKKPTGSFSGAKGGGKPPAGRKPAAQGGKPYGEKKSYGEQKPFDEKRAYGDKKQYPEKKTFGKEKHFGEEKPFGEKKPFGDKKPFGEHKPYSDKKPFPQNKPYPSQRPNFEKRPLPPANREEDAVTEQELLALVASIAAEPVTSLSALAAHAKKRAAREKLEHIFADRAVLYAQLSAPEPKARKNAARVLGAIAGDAAQTAIFAYVPPEAADETEAKHVADIIEAHEKAKAALTRDIPLPPRVRLSQPHDLLLVPPVGFGEILLKETTSRGFIATLTQEGVHVTTDQIKTLQEIRCALEILLPLGHNLPLDAAQIAALASPVLSRPYRIELRNYTGDRAAFIRAVSVSLGGGDNPSRYADELRIVCNNDKCDLFIRPRDVPDTRFLYRKRALPASIHPVQAACLARYALSFLSSARPRTLDPFCGSGTLLFELERAVPTALIGVDSSERALDAARENAAAAHSAVKFVHKDILKFEPREPFDLILSNMPFGNRVGTHSANEALYRDFVHALPKFLAQNGVAVLYTMEHKLLAACLKSEPSLTLAAELTTEAGGLNPRITVVRKK